MRHDCREGDPIGLTNLGGKDAHAAPVVSGAEPAVATERGFGTERAVAPERTSLRDQPLYASTQNKVREFVVAEGLSPGARLPAERVLAQRLGVSRTSLRQALTVLRVEGLVDVRRGDGIYLLRDANDVIPPIAIELAAHPELPALGEVRNALEALAARSAARRRTDQDLAEMVAALRLMESELAEGKPGLLGDRAFHGSVRAASHNEVLDRLLLLITEGATRIAEASLARDGQPERSLAAHRLILDAIIAREPDDAHRLMYDHLELTGRFSNGEVAAEANGDISI